MHLKVLFDNIIYFFIIVFVSLNVTKLQVTRFLISISLVEANFLLPSPVREIKSLTFQSQLLGFASAGSHLRLPSHSPIRPNQGGKLQRRSFSLSSFLRRLPLQNLPGYGLPVITVPMTKVEKSTGDKYSSSV